MKSFCILSAMVALLAFPVFASAQVSVGVNGAFAVPATDFRDSAEPGGGGGLELFLPSESMIQVGARFTYNVFDVNEDDFDDGESKSLELVPSVRLRLLPMESALNVFLQGGYGWYLWSIKTELNEDTIDDFDETDDGGYLGVGFLGRFSEHVQLSVSPQYHMIRTENEDDDNLFYWSFNIGLVIE